MTRTEMIRQRRQMHRRIRQAVVERRMAAALQPPASTATVPAQQEPRSEGGASSP